MPYLGLFLAAAVNDTICYSEKTSAGVYASAFMYGIYAYDSFKPCNRISVLLRDCFLYAASDPVHPLQMY